MDRKTLLRLWRRYARTFLGYSGRSFWIALLLMLVCGLTESLGLLMLVPLLHSLGIGGSVEPRAVDSPIGSVLSELERIGASLGLEGLLLIFLALSSVRVSAAALRTGYIQRVGSGFDRHLRTQLLAATVESDWRVLGSMPRGTLESTVVNDVTQVSGGTFTLLMQASTLVLVAAQLVVALTLAPAAATLCVGVAIALLAISTLTARRSAGFGVDLVGLNRRLMGLVGEIASSLKLIKSLDAERRELAGYVGMADKLHDLQITTVDYATRVGALLDFATAILLIAVAWVAIRLLHTDGVQLILLLAILARATPGMIRLHGNLQQIAFMMPAFASISDMIDRCRAAEDKAIDGDAVKVSASAPAICLERVWFRYLDDSPRWALRNVSLEIAPGELLALTGPSGAGKTTLGDLLLGLLAPSKGHVLVDGERLDLAGRAAWRRQVGYVPQEPRMFARSLAENLRLARPEADERAIWGALEAAAVADVVRGLDDGLETELGARGLQLSGGEAQRLAIARALIRRPRLLLLDEPTSALDPEAEQLVMRSLQSLRGQVTMVVITHRAATLAIADREICLGSGSLPPD